MQKFVNKVKDFSHKKKNEFMFLVGLVLVVFGSLLLFVFPLLLGIGFDMNFKLQEGKFIFDNWKDLPIPLYTRAYLFDIQNPEEFKNGDIPQVKEIGPYVYRQHRTREVIEWSDNNRKVKFQENFRFEFDESQSVGPLTDKLTLVNVPLLIVFSIINTAVEMFPLTPVVSPIVNNVVNTLLVTHRERLIETRTVGDVLNGRRITLLDTIDIVAKPLRMIGLPIPEYGISSYKLKDNTYGFLAIRNDTTFGPFEAFTGMEGTRDQFTQIASYQDKRRLGIYRDESCDALNGTDGMLFGTFPDTTKPIYVMNIHACRALKFEYSGYSNEPLLSKFRQFIHSYIKLFSSTFVNGIPAYRYEFSEDTFDGPEYNRQNWCFCPKGVEPRKCHGLLDLGQCLAGVPFAMTLPHFLTSQRFLSGVRGLSPDRQKHLGFFDIEKSLGITLRGSARFQINLKLRPFTFVPGLNNFRSTLLPYLWLEEGATIEGPLGILLLVGSWAITGTNYAFILTILLGTGISLMSSATIYKKRRQQNRTNQNSLPTNLSNLTDRNDNTMNRSSDYEPPPLNLHWNTNSQPNAQAMSRTAYNGETDNYQNSNQINTISNTVGPETQNIGDYQGRNQSADSEVSRKSIIDERHSGHSVGHQVLPPVEDGTIRTTLIIQRKPFPNEINNNNV